MKRAYSFEEIKAAERRSGKTGSELMALAGRALADAVASAMRRRGETDCVFVCGGGNNGGDGFVAASILAEAGADVSVVCLAREFSPACAAAKSEFRGEVLGTIPRRAYGIAVDCLFGTGISRPVEGTCADLVAFVNAARYRIACDLPSGLAEDGRVLGACVRADETVTMGGLKRALLLADGADAAGRVSVADLSLPLEGGAEVWEEDDVRALFPERKSHSNKGNYGRVAVVAGYGTLGAPLLSVGGALRTGAGYVEFRYPTAGDPVADEVRRAVFAAKYPACITGVYHGAVRADAVAFGMGAGTGAPSRAILKELLASDCGTLVLDADALQAELKERLQGGGKQIVLTPHVKEFARLAGKTLEEVASDPVGCARAFSAECGAVVVLKDNRTVIAAGDRVAINVSGSPALAKGGSGDVLAGLLAGTCARGVAPFEAAVAACFLLGRAGEIAAERMGEYAPDASDVVSFLPEAMARLTR